MTSGIICILVLCRSGGDPLGVPGEQGGVPDVLEAAVQHHHPLQAHAHAPVGVGPVAEALDVVVDGGGVDALVDGPLPEHLGVVDALCAGDDFLAAHEEVVGAGVVGVVLAGHGVEGAGSGRVAVQHVEVSVVLVLHQLGAEVPNSPSFFSTSVLRSSMGGHSTPLSLRSWMPSAKVSLRTGSLHLKGANSNCWLMAASSLAQRFSRFWKMKGKSSPKKSSSSKQCSLMVISTSSPTNSHMCLCVKEFSARKTGPISNTRWKSPITHICLYSWGDCARHALRLKQLKLNTLEPPSEEPPIILGVWISTKSLSRQNSRNSWHTPEDSLKIACLAVVRRSITLLSSLVFIFTIGASFSSSFASLGFSSRFFFSFLAFFSFPFYSATLPQATTASSVFSSLTSLTSTLVSTVSTLGLSLVSGRVQAFVSSFLGSSSSSLGSNSLCSTFLLASAICRGSRLVALLTTRNLLICSSTCWVQLSMAFSGFTTVPQMSTMLSLGTSDIYLSISLEMASDLKAQACRVQKLSRRTTKQLFPLPLTLCTLALTSTYCPSRPSSTRPTCVHLRPDCSVDWMKGQSPNCSVLQSTYLISFGSSMLQKQL